MTELWSWLLITAELDKSNEQQGGAACSQGGLF